jgi:polar amino acid transport system substrate-binding protein
VAVQRNRHDRTALGRRRFPLRKDVSDAQHQPSDVSDAQHQPSDELPLSGEWLLFSASSLPEGTANAVIRNFLLCATLLAIGAPGLAADMAACADSGEMPPFVYTARMQPGDKDAAKGIAVDLLKMIAAENGWKLRIDLLPWARCMHDAEGGRYGLVLNVGREEAQANNLLLSKPFFLLHGVYIYSRRLHPNGVAISSMDDLLRQRICGMGGYRYEAFGIPSEAVDRGATRGFDQLVIKLQLARCDFALSTREEVAGRYLKNTQLREQIADGSLRMAPLPNAQERSLHFGVPSALPEARSLVTSLNNSLARLDKLGAVSRLVDQHLGAQDGQGR